MQGKDVVRDICRGRMWETGGCGKLEDVGNWRMSGWADGFPLPFPVVVFYTN